MFIPLCGLIASYVNLPEYMKPVYEIEKSYNTFNKNDINKKLIMQIH